MAIKSLREQILASDDTQSETVEVPQWGVSVEVRGMSGKARATYLANYTDDNGRVQWEALYPTLLIQSVFDPDTGEKVFQDADAEAINMKSGEALETVAQVALRLSGMDREQQQEAGKDS